MGRCSRSFWCSENRKSSPRSCESTAMSFVEKTAAESSAPARTALGSRVCPGTSSLLRRGWDLQSIPVQGEPQPRSPCRGRAFVPLSPAEPLLSQAPPPMEVTTAGKPQLKAQLIPERVQAMKPQQPQRWGQESSHCCLGCQARTAGCCLHRPHWRHIFPGFCASGHCSSPRGHNHGVFPSTLCISCVLEASSSCSEGQSCSTCCSPGQQEL